MERRRDTISPTTENATEPSDGTLAPTKKIEVLYDHYKDSFAHARTFLQQRDHLFYIVLLVLGLTVIQISSPAETENIATALLSRYAGIDVQVGVTFATSVVWMALLSLLIKYYQTVIHIQRLYHYVHGLEERLSAFYGETGVISREGAFYAEHYPRFSWWAWVVYTMLFPVLMLVLTTIKIAFDITTAPTWTWGIRINLVIFGGIVLSTLLYMHSIHQDQEATH